MYCLGLLKSKVISLPMIVNPIDTVDRIVYQRYLVNMMTPEELIPQFSPQIISITNRDLDDQEYPPLEQLSRASITTDQIYLLYNAFTIYFFVGRNTDPYFIYEIFKANDVTQIDKAISEDEIFANVEES